MNGLMCDGSAGARGSRSCAPEGPPGASPERHFFRTQSARGGRYDGGAPPPARRPSRGLDHWFGGEPAGEKQQRPPGEEPRAAPRKISVGELIAAGLVEEYDLVGIGARWHVHRCRVCGCGPWVDQAHVIEHFQILGTDRAGHLHLYQEFLRLYQG